MRGLVALTVNGGPFPGREAIQIIAFNVTIGTLLLKSTTLALLAQTLRIDLSAKPQSGEMELTAGLAMLDQCPSTAFQERRIAISEVVAAGNLDDEIGHTLLLRTDLEQAADNAQQLD